MELEPNGIRKGWEYLKFKAKGGAVSLFFHRETGCFFLEYGGGVWDSSRHYFSRMTKPQTSAFLKLLENVQVETKDFAANEILAEFLRNR